MVSPVAIALEQAKALKKKKVSKKKQHKTKARPAQPPLEPKIELITPWQRALEQAKSDLKRGSYQMDIYDRALEQDAMREKKMDRERRARAKKKTKTRHP